MQFHRTLIATAVTVGSLAGALALTDQGRPQPAAQTALTAEAVGTSSTSADNARVVVRIEPTTSRHRCTEHRTVDHGDAPGRRYTDQLDGHRRHSRRRRATLGRPRSGRQRVTGRHRPRSGRVARAGTAERARAGRRQPRHDTRRTLRTFPRRPHDVPVVRRHGGLHRPRAGHNGHHVVDAGRRARRDAG